MRSRFLKSVVGFGLTAAILGGCGEFQRADDAGHAKSDMIGLGKEKVLACMGIPKHKQTVGSTEVWAYDSTDHSSSTIGDAPKSAAGTAWYSMSEKSSCTVSVVMTNDRVSAVHYNGATGGLLAPDEQCGYAVANCVTQD